MVVTFDVHSWAPSQPDPAFPSPETSLWVVAMSHLSFAAHSEQLQRHCSGVISLVCSATIVAASWATWELVLGPSVFTVYGLV